MGRNYYDILGVDKKASKEDIKKAFRKLAHTYHPDKKGGDEQKFKEVNEAYTVLSNDKKRAEYDAYGRVFSGAGGAGPQAGQGGFGGFDFSDFAKGFSGGQQVEFDFSDLGDIFGDFFGGQGRRVKRGRDISIDIELSFEESISGVERTVLLTKPSICDVCDGSGAESGSKTKTCETCKGQGKVRESRQSMFGTFTTVSECSVCYGRGSVPEKKCKKCKGYGVAKLQQEIKVRVPAGIDNGEMIRLSGAGEALAGGQAGDLYVKVHVKEHDTFRKEGADLVMTLPVKLTDALLGAKYTITTVDGKTLEVSIPERVAEGQILRVRDKGVPLESGRGDLLIKIKIALPEKLSRKVKKKIEELRDEGI